MTQTTADLFKYAITALTAAGVSGGLVSLPAHDTIKAQERDLTERENLIEEVSSTSELLRDELSQCLDRLHACYEACK